MLFTIIILNIITFIVFGVDKWLAKMHISRVSEFLLLLFCLLGGSCGAIISMVLFRHKISKKIFLLKLGIIILIQGAAIVWGVKYL